MLHGLEKQRRKPISLTDVTDQDAIMVNMIKTPLSKGSSGYYIYR